MSTKLPILGTKPPVPDPLNLSAPASALSSMPTPAASRQDLQVMSPKARVGEVLKSLRAKPTSVVPFDGNDPSPLPMGGGRT